MQWTSFKLVPLISREFITPRLEHLGQQPHVSVQRICDDDNGNTNKCHKPLESKNNNNNNNNN
jgi:hypothetical protein